MKYVAKLTMLNRATSTTMKLKIHTKKTSKMKTVKTIKNAFIPSSGNDIFYISQCNYNAIDCVDFYYSSIRDYYSDCTAVFIVKPKIKKS